MLETCYRDVVDLLLTFYDLLQNYLEMLHTKFEVSRSSGMF